MNLPENTYELRMTLELVAEDIHEINQNVVNATRREAITALEREGYFVQPGTTPTRGGELVEVIKVVVASVWEHRDIIDWTLTNASNLVTICTGVVPLIKHVFQAHQKRARPGSDPIKITLAISGAPVSVEAEDLEKVEAGLHLAKKFYDQHPDIATRLTLDSSVKVQGKLPKQRKKSK